MSQSFLQKKDTPDGTEDFQSRIYKSILIFMDDNL